MSGDKQVRASKIQVEIKEIAPKPRKINLKQLNADADGSDLSADADGSDFGRE